MEWYVSRNVANAKVNLALHVTGRRADGYHDLDSLVAFTTFGDTLDVQNADQDSFAIDGPYADALGAAASDDNLVLKTRDALRAALEESGGTAGPVSITLTKNIPIAAGLGGGSADAATTLRLLSGLWAAESQLATSALDSIALSLGADVPMCLAGPKPLHVTGIGDEIAPVVNVPRFPVVLVNARIPLATPSVFKTLDRTDSAALPGVPGDDLSAPYPTERAALLEWLERHTRNDLQGPAIRLQPTIEVCLAALENGGAKVARMTGSGATCFGLFDTMESADEAQHAIATRHPDWFCIATQTLGSLPNRYGDVGKWLD